jgi:hypothetical protein
VVRVFAVWLPRGLLPALTPATSAEAPLLLLLTNTACFLGVRADQSNCALLGRPSAALFPSIRFVGFLYASARMLLQAIDCAYRALYHDHQPLPRSAADDALPINRSLSEAALAAARARDRSRAARLRSWRIEADQHGRSSVISAANLQGLGLLRPPLAAADRMPVTAAELAESQRLQQLSSARRSPASASSVSSAAGGAAASRHDRCCAICLTEMSSPTPSSGPSSERPPGIALGSAARARVFLPCAHSYHALCIRQWQIACERRGQVPCCPSCRHPLRVPSAVDDVD